ncbi:MAG: Response regulator receiver [Parcubacteria group bacterium GW2011_GWE2_39_37]|uniref:Response regulator receiver n=1 Tax=Candidatus Falkowbacteria bacterium GW2011_GWF2_39_8 TaxID=1618642 RepID=A0A0G0T300_9BACT|nr:MAG: Response regulator receiver [Parcubacteria group bacterium GW2011_GWE2_39_37]KKR32182.1 MAG: Response regulator receiver [Candidatus Falkowbacteria bacterium GW2011_GWF2_39_8]
MEDKKAKILIAEDDPAQLMMLEVSLMNAGYSVVTATNGKTTITQASAEKPDLIFLDMLMPDIGGLDVIKKLKGDPITKNIKIVALSNLNKKEIIDQCLAAGALDFLVKMLFVPKDIVEKVGEYLKK